MSYARYELGSLAKTVGSRPDIAGDITAILEPGLVSWNYEHLQRYTNQLSKQLLSLGLGQDDTVAVAMPDGAACLLTQLAVMSVCACAPLNPQLTPAELKRDLVELGVKALICPPGHDQVLALAEELRLIAILAFLREGEPIWDPHDPLPLAPPLTAKRNNGAALLLHTSATTGRRKIVPLTRANLRAAWQNTSQSLRLTSHDRLLIMARLFHAQGILSALSQWSAGGTVIVSDTLDPAVLTRQITDLQPTWYTCGPTLHHAILSELREQSYAPPALPTPHPLRRKHPCRPT